MMELLFVLIGFALGMASYHYLLKHNPTVLAWLLKTVKRKGDELEAKANAMKAQAQKIVTGTGGPGPHDPGNP
jgi:hemoglobin-like flavoprotein